MRKLAHIICLTAAAFLSAILTTPLAAEPPKQIRFGLLPAEDPGNMVRQFNGIADHIGKQLGLPVSVRVTESYNSLIEAMRAGHLEVVYVGGSQYVKMRNLGMDVVPLVLNKDETKRVYYKACIITYPGSGITSFADLKGKTFAFVTPTSTSGGIGPAYLLIKNGIDPNKDFKHTIYAGKHDAVLLAVKNKKVDAGAVGDIYFPRWKERSIMQYESYDEPNDRLTKSDVSLIGCVKVPNTVMVTFRTFGDKFITAIQNAFLSLSPDAVNAYRVWPSTGFVPTKHEDFLDLIAMEKLGEEIKKKHKK
jgi:phosphonate transport system substrate-binding protein